MCVRIDDPPEPCMPDPSKPDEIILNCTINGCVAECTQYVCKKKEPKEEVCDSEEEEPPPPEVIHLNIHVHFLRLFLNNSSERMDVEYLCQSQTKGKEV
jgi:hypothetical protein